MSELRKKLKTIGLTYSGLAKLVGSSGSYISEIGSGDKTPSLRLAVAIEKATKGHVTPQFLLSISQSKSKIVATSDKINEGT